MKTWHKRGLWILGGIALVLVLVWAFLPSPILVDAAQVERGSLQVVVEDDGRTRVRDRYIVSAPISGRLLRVHLEAGDRVQANETLVAQFLPTPPSLLDARARQEARARLRRAEAAVQEAEARAEQAAADMEFALRELERLRELHSEKVVSQEALDEAERNERRSREGLEAARSAVAVARYERQLARASLTEPSLEDLEQEAVPAGSEDPDPRPPRGKSSTNGSVSSTPMGLRSPITGTVLRVHEESARTLTAGAPILEVGDLSGLEVVADFLSQDAVRVRPGMEARILGWGGRDQDGAERELRARVRRVEPGGVTKVSALGVEEQRVDIVLDPFGDPAGWRRLGDGYRVVVRIILWRAEDVRKVPTGALFREGGDWAVYVVEAGEARKRTVRLGQRGELEAEVLDGLQEAETVVLYPSDMIEEGTPVDPR